MSYLKFLLTSLLIISIAQAEQAQELGKIKWHRNYEQALELSKQQDKPIMLLFQEVPGCLTCRNYGNHVLSHPLMVEIIEDQFIPLAIHNNKGGEDARILKLFKEPSWNNPVVRIIDGQSNNIVPRLSGNYSASGLLNNLKESLNKKKQKTPAYMELLIDELQASQNPNIKEAYYSMYCFWTGEVHLGQAKGVVATESGFMKGKEVVKVSYDSKKISHAELSKHAQLGKCSPITEDDSYRISAKDTKYQLRNSQYANIPLSNLQKLRINTALGSRKNPQQYLSPRQIKQLAN